MAAKGKRICRVCGADIIPVIDFGKMPLANAFLKPEDYATEYYFNLTAGVCGKCSMFQLLEQPDPSKMFHSAYPFYTSSSNRMVQHFKNMTDGLGTFLRPGARVLEIGSNDGTLLANFKARGFDCLGIEPSANVAAKAVERGIQTCKEFFNQKTALRVEQEWGKAALVIAANCLCHIPEPAEVFKGLDVILEKDGVAVFEDPYLGDVLEKTAYDQIYDEHVFLFSVISMKSMVERFGFEIFDLEPQWTHGGSMRYLICRKGTKQVSDKVRNWLDKEKANGLDKIESYERFKTKCESSKQKLLSVLEDCKQKGLRILGYAATSKSTTVLNYCGIGPALIEAVVDTTPDKQGKVTPGTHIPVLPYSVFSKKYPDGAVLFAWNHRHEIFEKEKEYSKQGGFWIEFVPEVSVRKGDHGV